MKEAEVYVFLDNVQFEARSWQCRNRIKSPTKTIWLSVPTHHESQSRISEVDIDNSKLWMRQHWNALKTSYGKAPYFRKYSPFFKSVFEREWMTLAALDIHIVRYIAEQLGLSPIFVQASKLGLEGKRTNLLLEICKMFSAERYLSSIGAKEYMKEDGAAKIFEEANIKVGFLEFKVPAYPQLFGKFVPDLSIIDCLFNCGPDTLKIISNENTTTYYELDR